MAHPVLMKIQTYRKNYHQNDFIWTALWLTYIPIGLFINPSSGGTLSQCTTQNKFNFTFTSFPRPTTILFPSQLELRFYNFLLISPINSRYHLSSFIFSLAKSHFAKSSNFLKPVIMHFSPIFYCFPSLKSKYPPLNPTVKHPHCVFFLKQDAHTQSSCQNPS